jgi:alanine racemase
MIRSAHATLNLSAVARNLARLRSFAPQARVMAVIKANAYGHGLVRIARSLPEADAFAVARLDEGLALRQAGIRQRIAVLQGYVGLRELELHAAHGLEPVVHSPGQVELLERAALKEPLPIWLKLDTGMHRLGLLAEEFAPCLRRLEACPSVLRPIPVMTHLASADLLDDALTDQQLERFRQALAEREAERSIANSAGLLAWDAARTEWVRPGIALYGVSPFPGRTGPEEGLAPVMTFRTRLIAIKRIEAGATVGYGGGWVCQRPTRLGVAAVGYGDGYPRHARPGTPVLVRNRRVPLIGRVSMDMITLDLTECPEAEVEDEVVLWGEGLPVEEIADNASTIAYELLCGITQRVKMVETA